MKYKLIVLVAAALFSTGANATCPTYGCATVGGDMEVKSMLKVDKVGFGGGLKSSSANASLVNNTSHGLEITSTATKITGGSSFTSLTLDDRGATFANSSSGTPARISGVANGVSDYDAVNYRQLQAAEAANYRKLQSVGAGIESRIESFVVRQLEESKLQLGAGIASTAAIANIPAVDSNKRFSIGAGVGSYGGQSAVAIGGSFRVLDNLTVRASAGSASGQTTFGGGASMSW